MLRNPFEKTLRDQRWPVLWWSLGMVGLSFYLGYIYPFVEKMSGLQRLISQLPAFVQEIIKNTAITTPEGFFNLQPFSIFAPLLMILYAIARGSDLIAGEEERGTLELVLAAPVSRSRLWVEKTLASVFIQSAVAASLAAGLICASSCFSIPLRPGRIVAASLSCFCLAMVFFFCSLFVGCLTGKRSLSSGITGIIAAASYLLQTFANWVPSWNHWRKLSPFYYYNNHGVIQNGLHLPHLQVLAAICLVLALASLFFFRRRDLHF